MDAANSFSYKTIRKNARKLYSEIGVPLLLFLVLFGIVRDFVFMPILGRIWGLAMMTTPDGYIGTSNLVSALIKSPWIILIGIAIVIVYAVLVIWQISAIIIAIGYTRRGQKIRVPDLIRISMHKIKDGVQKKNWMIMLYALVIIPLTNTFQTSDMISSFLIPEYIQDFINAKTVLFVIYVALMLAITYLALRWIFVLPSFALKKNDFRKSKEESVSLTSKGWLLNGLNYIFYYVVEFVRRSIAPLAIVMIPIFICYLFTSHLDFSARLFNSIGVTIGLEAVKSITASLVQLSAMCFVVELYFSKLQASGEDAQTDLPEIEKTYKGKLSTRAFYYISFIVASVLIAATYLGMVTLAQTDSSIILEMFGTTEIIAHKGYSSKAPENTMPAFDLADKSDAVSYIELDVWSSKDGIPVVIHNSTITDATGVDKNIYDCTYEELQTYPAPYSMSKEDFPTARIPSLEDVIQKYAYSTPLLIEIKGFKQDPELPAKIVELMKKYGCEYTSKIHSGNYEALKAVKEIDPDIECGFILAMVTGDCYDLPYADFFSIEHTFVNQNTVALIHRRGKEVYAWTVNYPESANGLKFTGVDGLITDVPDDIYEFVSDNNDLIEDVVTKTISGFIADLQGQLAMQNYENGNY